MVEVPVDMPFTTPVAEPIVATAVLLLLHILAGVASLSVVEVAPQMVVVPVITAGNGFTVTGVVAVQLVPSLYVIVTVPADTPVTMPEEETVELRDPQMTEDTLTYKVVVLDGTLPARAGPCSMFIDPIGRPLSPVSVAGIHRRDRRRDRRRF